MKAKLSISIQILGAFSFSVYAQFTLIVYKNICSTFYVGDSAFLLKNMVFNGGMIYN